MISCHLFLVLSCSGHCRQLAPKWRRVAEALHGVVRVAAVNCDEQQALCQSQHVQGYPTIKSFRDGKWSEYNGDRSAPALRDYGLNLLPTSTVSVITKEAHMGDFLKKSGGSVAKGGPKWGASVLLFTAKPQTSALYKSLALRYKGKLAFGEVRGGASDLARRFNVTTFPSLLAVCGGDASTTVAYSGEMKNSRLTRWLNEFYSGKKCAEAIVVDATTDFGKLKVSQLKSILQARGVVCKDCVEKGDYVRTIQELVGKA